MARKRQRFQKLGFDKSTCELFTSDDVRLKFDRVELEFKGEICTEVFRDKNNKTLEETLEGEKYSKLRPVVSSRYGSHLDAPLGEFLLQLKREADPFYLEFLNKYGDLSYSNFGMSSEQFFNEKGVYAYYAGDELMYIGRSKDQFKKRINQGYGKIHPKNCYIDGQSTNCHLNALITELRQNISLWLHVMSSEEKIELTEQQLIQRYNPPWNIQQA